MEMPIAPLPEEAPETATVCLGCTMSFQVSLATCLLLQQLHAVQSGMATAAAADVWQCLRRLQHCEVSGRNGVKS